jgi:hypothetical protein
LFARCGAPPPIAAFCVWSSAFRRQGANGIHSVACENRLKAELQTLFYMPKRISIRRLQAQPLASFIPWDYNPPLSRWLGGDKLVSSMVDYLRSS